MDEEQVTLTAEELEEHYTLDGIYAEVIKYSDISYNLDNIIFSKSFLEKEANYLKSNLM